MEQEMKENFPSELWSR